MASGLTPFQPAYAAAVIVQPHLAQHLAAARLDDGVIAAALPDVDTIASMIDAAFWASLRREEGFSPKISLAYVGPEQVPLPITFERPIAMKAQPLTRLAPAVERPGIHLGVWCAANGDLCVWGATRALPPYCFVLEVVAPGLLVLKQSRSEESGKFVNVAVIEGDQMKIIDEQSGRMQDCPALLTSLLGLDLQSDPEQATNILIQLATSMRAHGRGGLLLVVPVDSDVWRESLLSPILYDVVPRFSGLADLMEVADDERPRRKWQDALRRAVDGIAGLTAVDGATVISDRYHLLGFGAKIVRRRGSMQVDRVIATEPIEGAEPQIVEPAQLGGTRHLSAAQFTYDQRDAIALVASQDGRFTVFGWSPCDDMVHAHRIEALLL
jgi:hypothetical protein